MTIDWDKYANPRAERFLAEIKAMPETEWDRRIAKARAAGLKPFEIQLGRKKQMAKSSKPGLTTKGGKPALNVQVPADLKKASKKGEVK